MPDLPQIPPEVLLQLTIALTALLQILSPATGVAAPAQVEPPRAEPPKEGKDRLLTTREAAAELKVSKCWIRAHQKELKAVKLSHRNLRIPESGIAAFRRRRLVQGS
jgi:hypothetical protein